MPRKIPLLGGLVAILLLLPSGAHAAACDPVKNPYPDTRYEGVNLTSIKAKAIGCAPARKVARGAHRKALGITPSVGGIRNFRWHGWEVVGDLRPVNDRYTATRGGRRISWRF